MKEGSKAEILQCNGGSYTSVRVANMDNTEVTWEQTAGNWDAVETSGGSDEIDNVRNIFTTNEILNLSKFS